MGYGNSNKYRYPDQPRNGSWYPSADEYKAKCALAEKLGDVGLRQWCVEQSSSDGSLQFHRADRLFKYIKEGKG